MDRNKQKCLNLHPVLGHGRHVEDVLAFGVATRVGGSQAPAAGATLDAPVRDLVQTVLFVRLVLVTRKICF